MKHFDPGAALFRFARRIRRSGQTTNERTPGQPAGTLVHVGEQRSDRLEIEVFDYRADGHLESRPGSVAELDDVAEEGRGVRWLHVSGLHDVAAIGALGERFGVPPLILEDIVNTACRPKIEEFPGGVFVLLRLLTEDHESRRIDIQQIAFVLLAEGVLLSFSEAPTAALDPVRQRIRTGGAGRIRRRGADYLMWALLDVVIDHYLKVAERMDDVVCEVEERFQEQGTEVGAAEVYGLKGEVTMLYRQVRPSREIVGVLLRADSELFAESTWPFLRDLSDHVVQVVEAVEDLRESASSLRDFYQTVMGNRMNEIMKVLTCFSTIFLPLTFIAGIYGMNFEFMPETRFRWAYPAVWIAFVLTAAGMFWLFRRKRWL